MSDAPVARVGARAYTIPTDAPEAAGTLAWDRTTLDREMGRRNGCRWVKMKIGSQPERDPIASAI